MNQCFIFLYYHFLDYFEQLACALPCYTFLTLLFHFITLLWHQLYTLVTLLLHIYYTFVTPLLHIYYTLCYTYVTHLLYVCNTRFTNLLHPLLHLRYSVVTLIITILMHPWYFVRSSFCGILSVFDLWHFILWHFVRDSLQLSRGPHTKI